MSAPASAPRRRGSLLRHGLWEQELGSLSVMRRLAVGAARVFHLIFRGFVEDECMLHASALTFATLMSLVPLLAIAFSVLKGLGAGPEVTDRLMGLVATMPVEFQGFVADLLASIGRTRFAALGWIGVLVLLVMVVQMLSNMEASFNRVWGIKRSRPLLRKVANYISTLVVVPILLMAATTLSASLASEAVLARLGSLAFAYRALLRISPFLAVWVALSFLYLSMPNTRVRAAPALVSGLAGAVLWLGWQKLYIAVQVGVAQFNVFYGTFAAVPIFLAWLYVSWLIVLLGAEVAFALQNFPTYQLERAAAEASPRARIRLALAILQHAAAAQLGRGPVFEAEAYAQTQRVPVRLVRELLGVLTEARLLVELAEQPGRYILLPAADQVPVAGVLELILQHGAGPEALGLAHPEATLERVLAAAHAGLRQATVSTTLRDLLPPTPTPNPN